MTKPKNELKAEINLEIQRAINDAKNLDKRFFVHVWYDLTAKTVGHGTYSRLPESADDEISIATIDHNQKITWTQMSRLNGYNEMLNHSMVNIIDKTA